MDQLTLQQQVDALTTERDALAAALNIANSRIENAKTAFREMRRELEALRTSQVKPTRVKTTPVVTYFFDRNGREWQKTCYGKHSTLKLIEPVTDPDCNESELEV